MNRQPDMPQPPDWSTTLKSDRDRMGSFYGVDLRRSRPPLDLDTMMARTSAILWMLGAVLTVGAVALAVWAAKLGVDWFYTL